MGSSRAPFRLKTLQAEACPSGRSLRQHTSQTIMSWLTSQTLWDATNRVAGTRACYSLVFEAPAMRSMQDINMPSGLIWCAGIYEDERQRDKCLHTSRSRVLDFWQRRASSREAL